MKKVLVWSGILLAAAATVFAAMKAGEHLSLVSTPQASLDEIDRMIRGEEYGDAIRRVRRKLLDDPGSGSLRLLLGNLYEEADEPEKAEPIYRELLEKDPEGPWLHYYLARALYGLNRIPEAVDTLEKTKRLAARAASEEESRELLMTAHGLLAEVYMQNTREYHKAIPELQRMLKYDPKRSEIRYQLGMAFAYARQYQSAYHEFDQIVRENPDTEIAKYAKNAIQYVRERRNPGRSDYMLDYGK